VFDDLYYEFEVLLKKLAIRAGKPVDQRLNRELELPDRSDEDRISGVVDRSSPWVKSTGFGKMKGERTRHRFGGHFGCGLDLEEAKFRSQRLELYACRAENNLDIFTGKADRTAYEIAFDIRKVKDDLRKVEDGLMMGIFKSP